MLAGFLLPCTNVYYTLDLITSNVIGRWFDVGCVVRFDDTWQPGQSEPVTPVALVLVRATITADSYRACTTYLRSLLLHMSVTRRRDAVIITTICVFHINYVCCDVHGYRWLYNIATKC